MRRGNDIHSEAIVLKARTSGENDLLVDFLSPGLGRLHGIARHGRKSQRRFGTVLECLNWVRLRGRDAGGLVDLSEATLHKAWHRIDLNLSLLTAGFHVVELIRQLVPERNPDARVFDLLKECLRELDGVSPENVSDPIVRFEYRLLDISGYGPNFKECLACRQARTAAAKFYFVYREGGLYCGSCLPAGAAFEPLTRKSLAVILPRFIEYQLGHPLKTRKFLTDKAFCG